jgi:hypothetical protein
MAVTGVLAYPVLLHVEDLVDHLPLLLLDTPALLRPCATDIRGSIPRGHCNGKDGCSGTMCLDHRAVGYCSSQKVHSSCMPHRVIGFMLHQVIYLRRGAGAAPPRRVRRPRTQSFCVCNTESLCLCRTKSLGVHQSRRSAIPATRSRSCSSETRPPSSVLMPTMRRNSLANIDSTWRRPQEGKAGVRRDNHHLANIDSTRHRPSEGEGGVRRESRVGERAQVTTASIAPATGQKSNL